jgi:hypothetical protein
MELLSVGHDTGYICFAGMFKGRGTATPRNDGNRRSNRDRHAEEMEGGIYGIAGGSLLSRSTSENLWDTMAAMWCLFDPGAKAFSYNKRTMDRAMGPFWPL